MSEAPGRAGDAVPEEVRALEQRLDLSLTNPGLALAALTHKSFVNEHRDDLGLADNERLEFLGDAVIDLAVSHRLMERFPGAHEGELSKMRAAVVDEQGLCEIARALDLGPLLRLGRGEELTGGRQKPSLLADAMEAVVAAVFLGDGLPPVLRIVDRFLGEAFARAAAGTLDRDFKTQLQELAQSRLRASPRYRVVAEHGPDHSKTFEVETDLRGEVLGRGSGRSKKDAEQAAARLALDVLQHRIAEGKPSGSGEVAACAAAVASGETELPTAPCSPAAATSSALDVAPVAAPMDPAVEEASAAAPMDPAVEVASAAAPVTPAVEPAPATPEAQATGLAEPGAEVAGTPARARARARAKRASPRRPRPKVARTVRARKPVARAARKGARRKP